MTSKRTKDFKKLFAELPESTKELARKNYLIWRDNHSHPSLKFKCVNKKYNLYSARVGDHYRAIGQVQDDTIFWTWIGTHEEYNTLIKETNKK